METVAQLFAQGTPATPTMAAGHVVIASGLGEVNIIFGHTRFIVSQAGEAMTPTPLVEWFMTISLSPQVAKQLHDGLTTALDVYAKAFGPIPAAPTPTKNM
jgi:hypothetical protein